MTALETLYHRYSGGLYAYAFSILKRQAAAEDAVSEAFVRLYRHASAGKSVRDAKALLFTICRNVSLDIIRREGRQETLPDEEATADVPDRADALAVRAALAALEDIERDIVTLHCVAGFKHREKSELMGMPEGTVRWNYGEAVKKLRRELGGCGNERV